MTEMNERDLGRPGEEAPELPPPPHSQPEPDVPDPDDETRDLVRPIKTYKSLGSGALESFSSDSRLL
jgi:hypothetical protein